MPDFTPAEIRDARNNPKPGDVWARGVLRAIRKISGTIVYHSTTNHGYRYDDECDLRYWGKWCLHATLIRRGA
jgi:hypothetical protein